MGGFALITPRQTTTYPKRALAAELEAYTTVRGFAVLVHCAGRVVMLPLTLHDIEGCYISS